MSAIGGNRTSINLSRVPLAFCKGLTVKKEVYWNRKVLFTAGVVISENDIDFYHDVALNIPISVRIEKSASETEKQIQDNIEEYQKRAREAADLSVELKAGDTLMEQGDEKNKDCYIIVEGSVNIVVGGNVVATIADPGLPIGEMSFLSGEPRTATVVAAEDLKVLRLVKEEKAKILRDNPTITNTILEALTGRLADTTNKMVGVQNDIETVKKNAAQKVNEINDKYNKIIRQLIKENGEKKGNLEVFGKIIKVMEENLGKKIEKGEAAILHGAMQDYFDYLKTQWVNENVPSLVVKEKMPERLSGALDG